MRASAAPQLAEGSDLKAWSSASVLGSAVFKPLKVAQTRDQRGRGKTALTFEKPAFLKWLILRIQSLDSEAITGFEIHLHAEGQPYRPGGNTDLLSALEHHSHTETLRAITTVKLVENRTSCVVLSSQKAETS